MAFPLCFQKIHISHHYWCLTAFHLVSRKCQSHKVKITYCLFTLFLEKYISHKMNITNYHFTLFLVNIYLTPWR
jgi:hypothetical protein